MPAPEQLLPTAEVASRLSKDVRTVHRMVQRGELHPVAKAPGLRGAYFFRPSDIEAIAKKPVSA